MMVGKKVALNIERPEPVNPQKRLVMEHVTCVDKEGVKHWMMQDLQLTAARSWELQVLQEAARKSC